MRVLICQVVIWSKDWFQFGVVAATDTTMVFSAAWTVEFQRITTTAKRVQKPANGERMDACLG
jgi:hypothetical protein